MGAFLRFLLVIVLIIYAAYFAFINHAAAFFDSKTKMVNIYLWRNLTFLDQWDLQTLMISVRLWELVLYGSGGAAILGWIIGWWMGRKGVHERTQTLRQTQTELQQTKNELQQTKQQLARLQEQFIETHRQHEARLADLAEKVLAITKAALPTSELQVESLPIIERPSLTEGQDKSEKNQDKTP
ncbi:MAG: hypothetical protein NZ805_09335 [Armatimonadetes bacterium]|nr:hypothetical protein [Armatimonadota bacterium]